MSTANSFSRDQLTTLRPEIPSIDLEKEMSQAERFQNETIRPILKFQNDLLVDIYQQYIIERKGVFLTLSAEQKAQYISNSLRKDQNLRNYLLGVLVGQFTLGEYQQFLAGEKEIRKRTIEMLIQRLQDQLN